jgi:hypothetical protein
MPPHPEIPLEFYSIAWVKEEVGGYQTAAHSIVAVLIASNVISQLLKSPEA